MGSEAAGFSQPHLRKSATKKHLLTNRRFYTKMEVTKILENDYRTIGGDESGISPYPESYSLLACNL